MTEEAAPRIDASAFSMGGEGALRITMPEAPVFTEEDVDAQLFKYVAEAQKGAGIHSISDLDDKWVQAHFPDSSTMEELRGKIMEELEREYAYSMVDVKYRRCADALVERLQGEIPADVLAFHAKAARAQYAERLAMQGMSKQHYMQQNNMSESEFEGKLRDDVLFQLKLMIALDKMVEQTGTTVTDEQLTDYLTVNDPDTFLEEAKATGKLEEARQAAARVKVMRELIEAAEVTPEA